jgi:hypothetical protein
MSLRHALLDAEPMTGYSLAMHAVVVGYKVHVYRGLTQPARDEAAWARA